MSENNHQATYITEKAGTAYIASSKGNLRGNQGIGRLVYISPSEADRLVKNRASRSPDRIDKDLLFRSTPYDDRGGRLVYEDFDKTLRLSSRVTERQPPFKKSSGQQEEEFFEAILKED
jgi:hypothetical protein